MLVGAQANRVGRPAEAFVLFVWVSCFVPSVGPHLLGAVRSPCAYAFSCCLVVSKCFVLLFWKSWGMPLQSGISARSWYVESLVRNSDPVGLSALREFLSPHGRLESSADPAEALTRIELPLS